jgi:hypothetical protein
MTARYASALRATAARGAIPYGYTLTLWSSGALLIGRHGLPSPGRAFEFLIGGVLGFAVVAIAGSAASAPPFEPRERDLVLAGAVQAIAAGAAFGTVDLVSRAGEGVAWGLGSFVATIVYLALTALELAVIGRAGR